MIASFLISTKISVKNIREKEKLKNSKHDKKLYEYNEPQPFTNSHTFKTINIKVNYFFYQIHIDYLETTNVQHI